MRSRAFGEVAAFHVSNDTDDFDGALRFFGIDVVAATDGIDRWEDGLRHCWLMMATWGEVLVSEAEKVRPAMTGIPMVAK